MHKANALLEKQLIWTFYLILAVIIYFMLQNSISEKSFFEEYLVKEIGLTIDTLYSSPGDIQLEFYYLRDVNLIVKKNNLEVKYLTKSFPKIYPLTTDKNYDELNEELRFNNATLKITRNNNKLIFESYENE